MLKRTILLIIRRETSKVLPTSKEVTITDEHQTEDARKSSFSLLHTHLLILFLSYTHTCSFSFSFSFLHTHTHALSLSCTYTRSISLSLSLTHTHTHSNLLEKNAKIYNSPQFSLSFSSNMSLTFTFTCFKNQFVLSLCLKIIYILLLAS